MKKLLTFFCVAALLLPVLLTGCGSGGATTVRLNEVTHSVFYAPQYVAMSLGFFADEGLNVELTNGGGADKVMNGVVPQVDAVVDTSVQFNMMAGAFTGGQGDYVTLFEPTATEVERAGHGYVLCSIGEASGEIPYTAYFASQSYMAAHPDVVQGFTNAIARAQRWIAEHTDREVAEAICDQFPDTSLDVLEAVTARHRQIDAWNEVPRMEQSALERLEAVMTEAGELQKEDWVDFTQLVDNSYADKAAAQLG